MPPTDVARSLDEPRLCVEMHDVAPATWAACSRILKMLDPLGVPLTLLVVPRYHGQPAVDRDAGFIGAISRRIERGDEVSLHGYFHLDDGGRATNPRSWFERRVMTRSEGEFAAIDECGARERIERGLAVMQRAGWTVRGFIPPAWLLSPSIRRVLADYPFDYTATRAAIYRLPSWEPERTTTIAYSPDAGWRRAMSRAMGACQLSRSVRRPLVRLALHPLDADFPNVMEAWRKLVVRLLESHSPITKAASLGSGSATCRTLQTAH